MLDSVSLGHMQAGGICVIWKGSGARLCSQSFPCRRSGKSVWMYRALQKDDGRTNRGDALQWNLSFTSQPFKHRGIVVATKPIISRQEFREKRRRNVTAGRAIRASWIEGGPFGNRSGSQCRGFGLLSRAKLELLSVVLFCSSI